MDNILCKFNLKPSFNIFNLKTFFDSLYLLNKNDNKIMKISYIEENKNELAENIFIDFDNSFDLVDFLFYKNLYFIISNNFCIIIIKKSPEISYKIYESSHRFYNKDYNNFNDSKILDVYEYSDSKFIFFLKLTNNILIVNLNTKKNKFDVNPFYIKPKNLKIIKWKIISLVKTIVKVIIIDDVKKILYYIEYDIHNEKEVFNRVLIKDYLSYYLTDLVWYLIYEKNLLKINFKNFNNNVDINQSIYTKLDEKFFSNMAKFYVFNKFLIVVKVKNCIKINIFIITNNLIFIPQLYNKNKIYSLKIPTEENENFVKILLIKNHYYLITDKNIFILEFKNENFEEFLLKYVNENLNNIYYETFKFYLYIQYKKDDNIISEKSLIVNNFLLKNKKYKNYIKFKYLELDLKENSNVFDDSIKIILEESPKFNDKDFIQELDQIILSKFNINLNKLKLSPYKMFYFLLVYFKFKLSDNKYLNFKINHKKFSKIKNKLSTIESIFFIKKIEVGKLIFLNYTFYWNKYLMNINRDEYHLINNYLPEINNFIKINFINFNLLVMLIYDIIQIITLDFKLKEISFHLIYFNNIKYYFKEIIKYFVENKIIFNPTFYLIMILLYEKMFDIEIEYDLYNIYISIQNKNYLFYIICIINQNKYFFIDLSKNYDVFYELLKEILNYFNINLNWNAKIIELLTGVAKNTLYIENYCYLDIIKKNQTNFTKKILKKFLIK